MIPQLHTVYVNMFGPVDVYQSVAEAPHAFAHASNAEVCGKLISAIEDQAEVWMVLSSRLDLIESTNPDWLGTFGLSWDDSIFCSCPEGEFFRVSAAQYEMISRVPSQTVVIIKDQGVHEVQFMTDRMLRNLISFREANGRSVPLIACDPATIELMQNLGPNVLTTLLFLHVGQIRNLTSDQFTILSPHLPVGCCHLVSQSQLQGLNFVYFSPERLEALVRGSGAQSEFIARLRVLSEDQLGKLISRSTEWLRANMPYEILQNASVANLALSLDMLRV